MVTLFGVLALLIAIGLSIFYFKHTFKNDKVVKIIKYVVYFGLVLSFCVRLFTPDIFQRVSSLLHLSNTEGVNKFSVPGMYKYEITYWLIFLLRFIVQGTLLASLISPWYKNDSAKRITAFANPIAYAFTLIFVDAYSASFAPIGEKYYLVKLVFVIIEGFFAILLSTLQLKEYCIEGRLKPTKEETKNAILVLLVCIFMGAYNCYLQNIIGDVLPKVQQFNIPHFIILLYPLVIFLAIFFSLRKKSYDVKLFGMQLLTLGLCIRHFYYYDITFGFGALPLALCHLGCVLLPIGVATKNKNIVNFTLTNSVAGALTALLLPSSAYNYSICTNHCVHFISNHAFLFILPMLCSILGIVEKCKFKDLKGVFIINIIYWSVVATLSVLLPNESFFFFNNEELINNVKMFGVDLLPLRNNLAFYFNIGDKQTHIYWCYWLIMFGFLNALTFIGFGIYKLEVMFGNKKDN